MSCCSDGRAPCAWETRYHKTQDALLLARYEARKWKEKYAQEKQRRRKLAHSLLETMALVEESRRGSASPLHSKRTRRSSSTFSDMDQIDSLLSPTLSSFDFDDDDDDLDEDDGDDGEDGGSDDGQESALRQLNGFHANGSHHVESTITVGPKQHDLPTKAIARATSQRAVRSARSSTVGNPTDAHYRSGWRRDGNLTLPPSNVLYRMLYSKPSSRDLWSSQASKFQSVARSVMFSMQLKKEHVFEHFFIVGTSVGKAERDQANRSPTGLVGFWKPKVFYEFAQRQGRPPDPTIADFCFPLGVPIVKCKPHQTSTLLGTPVSIWTTDAEQLQRHALDPFKSSGYTFRLTGAKGEVLYGLCVSVMSPLMETEDGRAHPAPPSPSSECAKRASCPNGSALRLSEPLHESYGSSHGPKRAEGSDVRSKHHAQTTASYLAPLCYCLTSKFPFYKLHFALLRQIIENDLQARQLSSSAVRPSDLYDITLTVESDLGVEFAVCRQPNETAHPNKRDGSGTKQTSLTMGSLSSVSSGMPIDRTGDASLSEEAPTASLSALTHVPGTATDTLNAGACTPKPFGELKKSFSSNDIASYKSANACVVEKPVVVRLSEVMSPRVAAHVQVGDVLEAIDGVSTASLPFAEALELVKSAPRPLKLRFHRLKSRKTHEVSLQPTYDSSPTVLTPTSADILQCARRLRIGDPGQWTTLRLPEYTLNYQFPMRDAERWSIGVVLRLLLPANIAKILAHLLLEKQVVVMGANSAQVSATCTALLLLLAPFQWQSTYIPQLPASLLDFLHSPVPFLVGCQPLPSTDDWPDVCFFDIDANMILAPIADHHISPTSIPHGDELLRLFDGAAQRFQRLRSTSIPWHELSDDEDKLITLTLQEAQIFLKDICSELTSMPFAPADGQSFYERLQEEVATIVRKSNFEDFLEEFSQTQLFCQYCETTLSAERTRESLPHAPSPSV